MNQIKDYIVLNQNNLGMVADHFQISIELVGFINNEIHHDLKELTKKQKYQIRMIFLELLSKKADQNDIDFEVFQQITHLVNIPEDKIQEEIVKFQNSNTVPISECLYIGRSELVSLDLYLLSALRV